MKDRRHIEAERQSIAVQQHNNPLANNNNNKDAVILDPLLDQIPEMGVEGLVATIDDQAKLWEALRMNIQKNRLMLTKPQYN
jgi:hypothetical protein